MHFYSIKRISLLSLILTCTSSITAALIAFNSKKSNHENGELRAVQLTNDGLPYGQARTCVPGGWSGNCTATLDSIKDSTNNNLFRNSGVITEFGAVMQTIGNTSITYAEPGDQTSEEVAL